MRALAMPRPLLVPQTAPPAPAPAAPASGTLAFPQRRPSSGAALPPRKRYKPSDADETGATVDDEPTTGPPPTDDETSPLA